MNCPSADIMSYGGVFFCIGPSTPCLISWFEIVTGGAGVPAQDVISIGKTHVPVVVVIVGVGCGVFLPAILAAGLVPP